MFKHLAAALGEEERLNWNMGKRIQTHLSSMRKEFQPTSRQRVQAHMPSMRKEFQSYFPDFSELDAKPILRGVEHEQ